MADLRPTHLIESHVSAYVVRREVTGEGEQIPHRLYSIEFGTDLDGTQDFFQMFWPVVVSHKIDEKSPLYAMSARDIAEHTFEIILTMEGITPETGNIIQVRILSDDKTSTINYFFLFLYSIDLWNLHIF